MIANLSKYKGKTRVLGSRVWGFSLGFHGYLN